MQKVAIVGAGLSGICLAYEFLNKGIHVTVIDNGINHSSKVAAGMINPLVFRRMTKSWRIDEMLPVAESFYRNLELSLHQTFYHPITIRRFFSSQQERDFWIEKQNQADFVNYMHPISKDDEVIHPHANQFGSGRVKNAAHVSAHEFLAATHNDLKQKTTFITEHCAYSDFTEKGFFKGVNYDLIVFAEGYLGIDNPWFNHLPLTQTKGETLTIALSEMNTTESLNRKCFLLPLDENTYKIGSNYSWNDPSLNPTEEAKQLILDNFTYLSQETPVIQAHDVGIRPTTVDRRPIIGVHPEHKKLAVFNGLGAKGYLIAPLLAKEFVESLIDGTTFNKECDIIQRIKSHK